MLRWATTTKASYVAPSMPLADPPAGYLPIGLEFVGRHGSRTVAKLGKAEIADAVLKRAATARALTSSGVALAASIRDLITATRSLGAGALTPRGVMEMRGIASRMTLRLPTLFSADAAAPVEVHSAGKTRVRASADTFVAALPARQRHVQVHVDDELLYFHKTDARYRAYLDHDPRLARVVARARQAPAVQAAAHDLLSAVLAPPAVDDIAQGRHGDLVANEVEAATSLFGLWQVAPALDLDLTGELPPAALEQLGFIDDLETFYSRGPAFVGGDVTYAMATVLLDHLLDSVARSSEPCAVLRFTHAEEILPLATLLQIPGADKPTSEDEPYTYELNPFRGAEIVPMAANLQWEIFSNGRHRLVRMLVNERPTRFASGLSPVAKGSSFYDADAVEHFYRAPGG